MTNQKQERIFRFRSIGSNRCVKKIWIIKKKGWYPTGLPLINSDPNEGIGYGVRVYGYNNGKKSDPFFEYTPYRLRFFAQYFNTTKNAQYHQLSLDMPYVANTQWRLRADALLTITPTTLYFGVGEDTLKPLTYHERNQPGAPQVTNGQYGLQESTFQYQRPGGSGDPIELGGRLYSGVSSGPGFNVTDRMYNRYTIQTPQLNFSTERSFFHGTVRLVAGFRLSNNIVHVNDGKFVKSVDPIFEGTPLSNSGQVPNAKTKLTEDAEAGRILGYHGGFVNTAKIGLVYDTRDFEPDPNSGVFLEGTYEKASKTIASDFDFQKYFGHAKFFYSPVRFRRCLKNWFWLPDSVLGFRMGMFHFLNIEIFGVRKILSPVWVDLERLEVINRIDLWDVRWVLVRWNFVVNFGHFQLGENTSR